MFIETEKLLTCLKAKAIEKTFYLQLSGSDNKIWLIPQNNVKQGMTIFQASSKKGRLVKAFLPYIYKIPFILKFLHIMCYKYDLDISVQRVICNIMGEMNLTYAIYIGNTEFLQNQKMVVQIMGDNRLLGYAKFSTKDVLKKSFLYEIDILNYLEKLHIEHIPKVLWSGTENGIHGFIQTTEKKGNESTVLLFDKRHIAFLKEIHKKTQKRMVFKDSPFEKLLFSFTQELEYSNWNYAGEIKQILERLKEKLEKEGYIGTLFHGDFTPWNVCAFANHIFVFDFEYAQYDYPEWMDVFHFKTQVSILSDTACAEEIYEKFEKERDLLRKWIRDPEGSYMCYLIYILYFYYKRWGGKLSENERSCKIWIQLLRKLDQHYYSKRWYI